MVDAKESQLSLGSEPGQICPYKINILKLIKLRIGKLKLGVNSVNTHGTHEILDLGSKKPRAKNRGVDTSQSRRAKTSIGREFNKEGSWDSKTLRKRDSEKYLN